MSTGLQSDNTPRQQPAVFQSTAISLGVCLLVAVIAYFFLGGKRFIDRLQLADANAKKVEEVSAELSRAETREKETQSAIATLQQKLGSPTITSEQLDEMRSRLKDLESGRGNQKEILRELSDQRSAIEGDRARNQVNVIAAAKLGHNVEAELKELEKEITAWTGANAALPKGDVGRRIATYPDLVTQYITLTEAPVVSFDDHDRWNQQLAAVYPRIKAAHENEEFVVVSQDDIAFLTELFGKVKSSRNTLRQHQRSLNLILASLKDADPGQQTLEEALASRQAERDAAYLRQLAVSKQAAADAVDAEYTKKITDEHREQRIILNKQKLEAAHLETQSEQQELDRIEAKAAALKAKRDAAAAARKAKLAAEQLARDFERDRAQVLQLLSPFVDFAITQPRDGNPISKGGIKRPTSLGALTSFGALNDTPDGLDALYHAGGHPANMRKKGGFPSFVSMSPIPNESVRRRVRQAQQFLVKYGPILVEKRMLSP